MNILKAQLGDEFPGAGTRVGGDDPFASAKNWR